MNLCIVNEDHPQCNVPRKVIKACPSRGWAVSLALSPSLSLRERPCRPFSPQDFCSPCEFVHCCHNTGIPWARVHITASQPSCQLFFSNHLRDKVVLRDTFCLKKKFLLLIWFTGLYMKQDFEYREMDRLNWMYSACLNIYIQNKSKRQLSPWSTPTHSPTAPLPTRIPWLFPPRSQVDLLLSL